MNGPSSLLLFLTLATDKAPTISPEPARARARLEMIVKKIVSQGASSRSKHGPHVFRLEKIKQDSVFCILKEPIIGP